MHTTNSAWQFFLDINYQRLVNVENVSSVVHYAIQINQKPETHRTDQEVKKSKYREYIMSGIKYQLLKIKGKNRDRKKVEKMKNYFRFINAQLMLTVAYVFNYLFLFTFYRGKNSYTFTYTSRWNC